MQAHRIKNLFAAIARYYDFLNSLLSLRRDKMWRRETVKASDVEPTSKVLDVCTGTGELALAYTEKIAADGFVIGSDFCLEMLVIGDRKLQQPVGAVSNRTTNFLAADTLILPFLDNTFRCRLCRFRYSERIRFRDGDTRDDARCWTGWQGRYLGVYAAGKPTI